MREFALGQAVAFEVAFPLLDGLPEMPQRILAAAYQTPRRHWELAAGLPRDIGGVFRGTSTFYLEDISGEHSPNEGERSSFVVQELV